MSLQGKRYIISLRVGQRCELGFQGVANYYNVKLPTGEQHNDIVWWYRVSQLECAEIKGMFAFYDEKVDVFVDGVRQK